MKRTCWLIFITLPVIGVKAQPGVNEMQQVRQDLGSDFYAIVDLSFVIAFIFGLVGALKIYKQIQDGNREITANISAWFYAAIFMLLSGLFLKALFGI